jgi:hypothetical protein
MSVNPPLGGRQSQERLGEEGLVRVRPSHDAKDGISVS